MGRPRKPTRLHLVRNTGKKHPERMRARKNEPVPTRGIGEPPKHLAADAKKAWREIVDLVPPGVLACSDRICVEIASTLLADFRKLGVLFGAPKLRILSALLARMGMSPADRSRVTVPPDKGGNPFGGF